MVIFLYGIAVFILLGGWTWLVALWRYTLLNLNILIDSWSGPLH